MKAIIADASCLISLRNAGDLEVLHLTFGEVIITPTVASEYRLELPSWISICSTNRAAPSSFQGVEVDAGEASSIELALELEDSLLIVDDGKARQAAFLLGLDFIGTLGVVLEAKKRGVITEIRPILQRLRSVGLWFTEELEHFVLRNAGEL